MAQPWTPSVYFMSQAPRSGGRELLKDRAAPLQMQIDSRATDTPGICSDRPPP